MRISDWSSDVCSSDLKAEYIWIDGTKPTPLLRSKTKILDDGQEPPVWGFDGSSTNQAEGHSSDCVLNPAFVCPDPIRGGDSILVLNEVPDIDMKPHVSNPPSATPAPAAKTVPPTSGSDLAPDFPVSPDRTPTAP